MTGFPAISDYEIPDTHWARVDRTLAGDLIREHPTRTPKPRPVPKPTLGAAILQLLEKS